MPVSGFEPEIIGFKSIALVQTKLYRRVTISFSQYNNYFGKSDK